MVLEVLRKSISSHRQKGDPIRGQPSIRKKRECDEEVSTPTTRAGEKFSLCYMLAVPGLELQGGKAQRHTH